MLNVLCSAIEFINIPQSLSVRACVYALYLSVCVYIFFDGIKSVRYTQMTHKNHQNQMVNGCLIPIHPTHKHKNTGQLESLTKNLSSLWKIHCLTTNIYSVLYSTISIILWSVRFLSLYCVSSALEISSNWLSDAIKFK